MDIGCDEELRRNTDLDERSIIHSLFWLNSEYSNEEHRVTDRLYRRPNGGSGSNRIL